MIFADKLIALRKRNGMSQEELADKLNVTRQSISKWEGAQSVPDLQKILQLSQLFGVSTDVLLKDELSLDDCPTTEPQSYCKKVTLEEANKFLANSRELAKLYSIATALCIFAVVPLLFFLSPLLVSLLGESTSVAVGLVLLFVFVALGAATFIYIGFKNQPYKYLEDTIFELDYGVSGVVEQRKQNYRPYYARNNIIGVVLCVLSVIPVTVVAITKSDYTMFALCAMLVMVIIAVVLFVYSGTRWSALQKLLAEGDYSKNGKKINGTLDKISGIYWPLVLAIYLGYSFITNNWGRSWIVWPVAAVLFAVVSAIVDLIAGRSDSDNKE